MGSIHAHANTAQVSRAILSAKGGIPRAPRIEPNANPRRCPLLRQIVFVAAVVLAARIDARAAGIKVVYGRVTRARIAQAETIGRAGRAGPVADLYLALKGEGSDHQTRVEIREKNSTALAVLSRGNEQITVVCTACDTPVWHPFRITAKLESRYY